MTFEEYFKNHGPVVSYTNPELAEKLEALCRRAWTVSEQNKDHPCREPSVFMMRLMCIPMLDKVNESRAMSDDEKMAYEVGKKIGFITASMLLFQVATAAWGLPFRDERFMFTGFIEEHSRVPKNIHAPIILPDWDGTRGSNIKKDD